MRDAKWNEKFRVGETYKFDHKVNFTYDCLGYNHLGLPVFEMFSHINNSLGVVVIGGTEDLNKMVLVTKPVVHKWYVGIYKENDTKKIYFLGVKDKNLLLNTHYHKLLETKEIEYIEK